nr:MAG TPA: hypothetical protein [Caudoviricetes sp.]
MLYVLIVTCSDKKVNNIMQEKRVIIWFYPKVSNLQELQRI